MKEILYYTVYPKQKSLSKLFTTKGWPTELKPYEANRYMLLCEDHSFNYIIAWMSFKLWIQNIDPNHEKFWFYLWQKAGLWRQSLVCSMITISENATLRRTLSYQHRSDSSLWLESARMSGYYFLWISPNVIWNINMICVSVIVLQMRNNMLFIIE